MITTQKIRVFPEMGIDFFDRASKMHFDAVVQMKNGITKLKNDLNNVLKERDSLLGIVSHLHEEKAALVLKVESQENIIKNLQTHAAEIRDVVDHEDEITENFSDFEKDSHVLTEQDVSSFNETAQDMVKIEIIDEEGTNEPVEPVPVSYYGLTLHQRQSNISHIEIGEAAQSCNTRGLVPTQSLAESASKDYFEQNYGISSVALQSSAKNPNVVFEAGIQTDKYSCKGRVGQNPNLVYGSDEAERPHMILPTRKAMHGVYSNDSNKRNNTTNTVYSKVISNPQSNIDLAKARRRRPRDNKKRDHICVYCSKGCRDAGDLKIHIRTHTNEKPYQCKYCNRSFAQTGHLLGHVRTHTGDRPYTCSYCTLRFTRSDALRRHIRTHTGEKPHKCEICEKSFSELRNLKDHRRLHTGEKPHICPRCKHSFTRAVTLRRHLERCGSESVINTII